jgi:predicted AlkP superfamily pyrophosphatase or phosphodiesterase
MLIRVAVALLITISMSLNAGAERHVGHVLIVSLDGGKPAVMKVSPMPVVMDMAKAGAATWNAQTIFPSITLPSHTSMLTGVGPAKHKIDWNSWQPEKGLVGVPTAFVFAKKAGLGTAMFVGKDKFKHLELPESLDKFDLPSNKALEIAPVAGKYLAENKPALSFVHFPDSDSMGHRHGWGSNEQIQAFADEDAAMKVLLDSLKTASILEDTVVIVTADHGGHDNTHGSDSPEDMTIPWIALGKGVKAGFEITEAVTTYDTAATALWLLGLEIPADWDGKPVRSAFTAGEAK